MPWQFFVCMQIHAYIMCGSKVFMCGSLTFHQIHMDMQTHRRAIRTARIALGSADKGWNSPAIDPRNSCTTTRTGRRASALRTRMDFDLHRNASQILINSGNVPDSSGPEKCSLGLRGPRTFTSVGSKNGCVSIKTWLCLELEQIRNHFYYTNRGYFINKSGLRFAVSQSIRKFL